MFSEKKVGEAAACLFACVFVVFSLGLVPHQLIQRQVMMKRSELKPWLISACCAFPLLFCFLVCVYVCFFSRSRSRRRPVNDLPSSHDPPANPTRVKWCWSFVLVKEIKYIYSRAQQPVWRLQHKASAVPPISQSANQSVRPSFRFSRISNVHCSAKKMLTSTQKNSAESTNPYNNLQFSENV